jgi:hypothetical protein
VDYKLGIIVPYRDRESNLLSFAPYMKEYLKDYNYELFIVEQLGGNLFNRAKLCNVGFDIAKKDCDYVVFHDVDLVPLEVDYKYRSTPTHLARRLDYLGYKACYPTNFGGVTLFNKESFIKVNGFSNDYWGWGGEDDDLRMRCVREGIEPGVSQGMFGSLPHPINTHTTAGGVGTKNWRSNSDKFWAFANDSTNFYYKKEGLSTLKYTLNSINEESNFTHIKVNIDEAV